MISIALLRYVGEEEASSGHSADKKSIEKLRAIGKPLKKLATLGRLGLVEPQKELTLAVNDRKFYTNVIKLTDRGHTLLRLVDTFGKPITAILIAAASIILAWLILIYIFGAGK